MMMQAELEDKKRRDEKFKEGSVETAVYTAKGSSAPAGVRPRQDNPVTVHQERDRQHQTSPFRSRTSPSRGNFRNVQCHHCGKRGHIVRDCRYKSGACLICGSKDHLRRDCPNYTRRSSTAPRCSRCSGSHATMQCQMNRNQSPSLN